MFIGEKLCIQPAPLSQCSLPADPGARDAVLRRDSTTPVILSPLALRSDMSGPDGKFEHVFLL